MLKPFHGLQLGLFHGPDFDRNPFFFKVARCMSVSGSMYPWAAGSSAFDLDHCFFHPISVFLQLW